MASAEPNLNEFVQDLADNVLEMLTDIDVEHAGEHMYSNYEKVAGYILRLQDIHNAIALEEIYGRASPELKKLRTLIVDPTIERFEKVAAFESRKITALQIEKDLERK